MSRATSKVALGQAKRDVQNARTEPANAPPTPGLSVYGALEDEGEKSASAQDEGRQEVTNGGHESPPEITHQSVENSGAKSEPSSSAASRRGLSSEEKERVGLLMAYGYSLRQAAARIGRAHTTVSRQLKKDPEFAAQLERYRAYAETDALGEVVKASKKSWRAAAWLLTYLQRREQMENAELAS